MISIAWVIGTIVSGLFVLGSGVSAVIFWRRRRKVAEPDAPSWDRPDNSGLWIGRIGSLVVLVITLAFYLSVAWPPFDMQYHTYKRISGTVTAVAPRLLGSGDSTEQEFAVQIDGQTYRCDDTRCALTKVGDTITLRCTREYEYAGTPGWDCNFVSEEQPDAS